VNDWREMRAKALAESWAERGVITVDRPACTFLVQLSCVACGGHVQSYTPPSVSELEGVARLVCVDCRAESTLRVMVSSRAGAPVLEPTLDPYGAIR